MFAKFLCGLCKIDCDEDGESNEKIFIKTLVICKGLVVEIKNNDCCELNQRKENHHAETMKVC